MSQLLRRAGGRHLAKHPLLRALSLLGIALGVAVVVSIDLANDSALAAFTMSRRAVMGRATDQVIGGPSGVPEAFFVQLRRDIGVEAAPIVEAYVSSPRAPGRALLLLGVDPLSEPALRPPAGTKAEGDVGSLMTVPGTGLLSRSLADVLGLATGDTLPLMVNGRAEALRVAGVIAPREQAAALALEDVVVVDIATAQELLRETGRLSRIDLFLSESTERERLRRRIEACGGGCEVVAAGSESLAATQVTRAFRLNTSALGLLALLVGMFLTYNTMTFIVVERRALFGTLRAIGVTRRELFRAVIAEAVKLAIPATALGLAGGLVLAKGLVYLVSRTINDLYFVVHVRELAVEPATLVKAACLGIGATVVSALVPAWEATRVPPGVSFRRSSREIALEHKAPLLAALGAATAAAAVVLVRVAGHSLLAAFAALFAVVFGAALATPLALRALAAVWTPIAGAALGLLGRMASRGMVTSLGRSSVAVAALMIAVATTVGVSVMVESFRAAVAEWLDQSLRSDLFVQPVSSGSRRREEIVLPEVARRIGACPGVRAVNTVRHRRVRTDRGEIDLHVPSYGDPRVRSYRFRAGRAADVYRALDAGDALAVTEPYASRLGLEVGDEIDVLTDRGWRSFEIAGVYVDYASDEGGIMMSRATYDRDFDDPSISGMGLMAASGVDLSALRERVRACAGAEQALVVRPARELRDASLAIFDRTFAITSVLRLLSLLVAVVGILSALSALALERARELAVLRAIGMTPSQVRRLVTAQTTLLGLSAGVLAVPLGFALAAFLVQVINRRSFGWSFELSASPIVVVEALALSVLAALVSGLYPAWAMSRARPAAALREE